MKTQLEILRLSAGVITDNGMLYASASVVDDNIADLNTPERIDIGQQIAKYRMSTDDNNRLAKELASSGLVPGVIEVDLTTSVRQGDASLMIVGFTNKKIVA